MRLLSMSIKNFKGIDEYGVRVNFAPITLLFGPNNAGKSTIMQALHLAKEVFCHPQADFDRVDVCGQGMDLGSFKDYVHKHDLNRQVLIALEMEVDGLPVCGDELEQEQGEDRQELDALLKKKLSEDDVRQLQLKRRQKLDVLLNQVGNVAIEFSLGWNYQNQKAELTQFSISLNKRLFTTVTMISHANEHVADIAFCDVSGFLPPEEKQKLLKQAEKVWKCIEEKPDDYGNELLDLKDAAYDALPPLLQPIANIKSVVEHLTGSAELAASAAGEPRNIRCALGAASVPDWGGFLPLEYYDIDPNYDPQAVSGPFAMNCLTLLSSFVLGPGKLVQDILHSLIYVGPLRTIPERGLFRTHKHSSQRWAEGLAAWDFLASASDAQLAAINKQLHGPGSLETGYTIQRKHLLQLEAESPLVLALRKLVLDDIDEDALPLLRDFLAQAPEIRLGLRNERTGIELEPHDMGVGISQILPVIVAAAAGKGGSLVGIEQPELHIHPAWQTALGDVFIQALAKGNPPSFLLETHSEHLLLRLLRRIRQTHAGSAAESKQLTHTDLTVHWVGNFEGRTEIYPLGVDEDGSFNTPWPEGFFAERGEELFG